MNSDRLNISSQLDQDNSCKVHVCFWHWDEMRWWQQLFNHCLKRRWKDRERKRERLESQLRLPPGLALTRSLKSAACANQTTIKPQRSSSEATRQSTANESLSCFSGGAERGVIIYLYSLKLLTLAHVKMITEEEEEVVLVVYLSWAWQSRLICLRCVAK